MKRVVFLLEEASMREFLRGVLPRVVPPDIEFHLIPHEGKSDLTASIPRKLRAWGRQPVSFVVLHDQESSDCGVVKQRLLGLCRDAGRPDTLVRIVCNHLESWLLGDLAAVGAAFDRPDLARLQDRRKYRDPDALANARQELLRLVPSFRPCSGARAVGAHAQPARNRSRSFQVFASGVREMAGSPAARSALGAAAGLR